MKNLKQRTMLKTIFSLVMLILSLAAAASAQDRDDRRTCSNASAAGQWGYTETGTIYLSGVAVPYASVGTFTLDADGNYSGQRTASAGGKILKATFKGSATVNADCTGKVTITFYDQSGNVTSTAIKELVFVDHSREARAIATSLTQVLPDGTSVSVPGVLTTEAKKLFPERRFFLE
jgi:hypothetical protein